MNISPSKTEKSNKIDIFNNDKYNTFLKSIQIFEKSETTKHYKNLLCLRPTKNKCRDKNIKKAYEQLSEHTSNNPEDMLQHNSFKLCVLPKNHEGKCKCNYNFVWKNKNNPVIKKLLESTLNKIYDTPGNDGFIFKNIASRLFSVLLSNDHERNIKDKNKKLSCAIPLKDSSSPILVAEAYVDWMSFIFHIYGIVAHIDESKYKKIEFLIQKHTNF